MTQLFKCAKVFKACISRNDRGFVLLLLYCDFIVDGARVTNGDPSATFHTIVALFVLRCHRTRWKAKVGKVRSRLGDRLLRQLEGCAELLLDFRAKLVVSGYFLVCLFHQHL